MRFAYADPPYPGQSDLVYNGHADHAGEVNHPELVARLLADYPDGWALSTSTAALPEVLALCPYRRGADPKHVGRVAAGDGVRVLAWVKPQPPPRPVRVQYAWEPVIVFGGRPYDGGPRTVRDWLAVTPDGHSAGGRGLPAGHVRGAKPRAFCDWVFRCLGAEPGDELDDLYPGSGAVARAWAAFTAQLELEL